jgi:hypothetical protein
MADIKRDQISDGQIEETEPDGADPSHEKNPAEVGEEERGSTEVNK